MRRLAPALALTVLAALLGAGCGRTEAVHESPVVVSGGTSGAGASRTGRSDDAIRIAVVTHGQASSPFWATVRNGVEAAARENDVLVSYRAPDVYSVQRMRTMIDRAVASRPDGLVVSIPESGVHRRFGGPREPGSRSSRSTRATRPTGAWAYSPTSGSPRTAPASARAGGSLRRGFGERCASISRSATRGSMRAVRAWRARCGASVGPRA